jgi:hypothetical protein
MRQQQQQQQQVTRASNTILIRANYFDVARAAAAYTDKAVARPELCPHGGFAASAHYIHLHTMRLRTITCSNGASGSLEYGEPVRTDYSASASLHLIASDEAAARIALGPLSCLAAFARCSSIHVMQLRSNARCSSASNPFEQKKLSFGVPAARQLASGGAAEHRLVGPLDGFAASARHSGVHAVHLHSNAAHFQRHPPIDT